MDISEKTLGTMLVEEGRLSSEDLRKVRRLQQERGERLERLLVDLGFIGEEDFIPLMSAFFRIPAITRKEFPSTLVPLGSMNLNFLRHERMFPLEVRDGTMRVAMANPGDFYSLQALELATALRLEPVLARERDIVEALDTYYGNGADGQGQPADNGENEIEYVSEDEEDVDHLRDLASEAPVIRLVNVLINRAVEQRASDIHIEPFEQELKIRYRIDGVLHDVDAPARRLQAAIVSRVKIMAKLNIAERRLPQDGRIKLRIIGREIDLRVSTLPTLYGESVVMRILDRTGIVLDLAQLGFEPDTLARFNDLIVRPYGMVLVTGPTGSGKTTTLYGALEKINSPEKKIITIEDPVEYQVAGVNQIHVRAQIGLTFANGLRSIVRQDPDVIMVGEIRDAETAEIAIQAALTGHLVFSTLHTNDAAGAVARLLEMGVEDYLLASSLLGVLAQRLVRRLCVHCRTPATGGIEALSEIAGAVGNGRAATIYETRGCDECSGTGYRGRCGIYEFLPVGDEVRDLILKRSSADAIKTEAVRLGMRTLREDGWIKVRNGVSSVAELLRVTQEE
jgi:general secretion pathway protein E